MPHLSTGQAQYMALLSTELTNRPSRVHMSKSKPECPRPCVDSPTSGDFPNRSHSPLPLCQDICSECHPPLPTLPLPQDLLGLSTVQPFFSTTVSTHQFFSTPSVFRDARNLHVSSSRLFHMASLSPDNLHMAKPLLLYWQNRVMCKHAESDIHSATESYGTLGK